MWSSLCWHFKYIFLNGIFLTIVRISLKFASDDSLENKSAWAYVIAWHRRCDKPLPEEMLQICIMMTSWNGNIFCVIGPLWGESTGHRWIPLTKSTDAELWSFLVFFDLYLDKWFSKQSGRRWFETPSHSLWRRRNVASSGHTEIKSISPVFTGGYAFVVNVLFTCIAVKIVIVSHLFHKSTVTCYIR